MFVTAKLEWIFLMVAVGVVIPSSTQTQALCPSNHNDATVVGQQQATRRTALGWMAGGVTTTTGWTMVANAADKDLLPDRFNVEDYLKTGMVMNPMGVSGQAGA